MGAAALPALMIGFSAVQSFAQKQSADAQADMLADSAGRTFALQEKELQRQAREVNRVSQDKKADAVKRAEHQLGAARAAAAELAPSSSSMARIIGEIGASEGTDLSRLEEQRKSRIGAIKTGGQNAARAYSDALRESEFAKDAATSSALLGFVGSGLQIGASAYNQQQQLEALENRTS